jgi:hypothetical protein
MELLRQTVSHHSDGRCEAAIFKPYDGLGALDTAPGAAQFRTLADQIYTNSVFDRTSDFHPTSTIFIHGPRWRSISEKVATPYLPSFYRIHGLQSQVATLVVSRSS